VRQLKNGDIEMNLFELKKQRQHALDKADSIIQAAENAGRELTAAENLDVETALTAAKALNPQIAAIEKKNTILTHVSNGMLIPAGAGAGENGARGFAKPETVHLSPEYADAFYAYIASAGKQMDAALYEGANGAGGYAVPVVVADQIVPLAPSEMAVRRLANVIPTVMDIKVPQKGSFGTASAKAENAAFVESDPAIGQFTLSAFMNGIQETISWELAQDVPAFQSFAVTDMLLACQMREEGLYVSGSGNGQAQGLIGNVGAGITEEPDANGNLVTINGTLDLTGTLNAVYHPNASWLMARTTSIIIRKAQAQANLFEPVWTRVGKQDFLHGYPVEYSSSMPTAARGAAPALFGDFKQGYVIGDRGGSGINVKVLDQPLAQQGQIVLLAYRRTDGRVRRSEAIQQYNVAAS
jgi:HK97 family phage major capsid protein